MTSREKVLDVERQVRAIVAGEQTEFICPFCNAISNRQMELLCCNEAAEVVEAVLDHIDHIERCEVVERAMERLDKMRSAVLVN